MATSTETITSSQITDPTKKDLVAPEPEHCPGPTSTQAGQGDACAGCPNKQICSSNAQQGPDPDLPVIAERLAGVRHKILVLSGKGGVGKSTFSALLGQAFAAMMMAVTVEGRRQRQGGDGGGGEEEKPPIDDDATTDAPTVGIMDTDICGPSIPKMLGVEDETIHVSNGGWSPVWVSDNLALMSVQFMLPNRHDAVIWRGPKKNGLIKKFLKDVDWGALEYLIVDTPPGTSDEHLSVNTYLKDTHVDGAVLVATPQEVALLDVRKEIDFCRKARIPILGIVENMAGFVCPKCTHESQIFRPTTGGAARLAEEMNIPFLGAVPLDPRVGMACDFGESFLDNYPDSPASLAVGQVVREICSRIGEKATTTTTTA